MRLQWILFSICTVNSLGLHILSFSSACPFCKAVAGCDAGFKQLRVDPLFIALKFLRLLEVENPIVVFSFLVLHFNPPSSSYISVF